MRNRLTEEAEGEWVFQLDADEYLVSDPAPLKAFLQLIYDLPVSSLVVSPKIVNTDGGELPLTRRIYRKKDGLHYYGVIHEDLRQAPDRRGEDLLHLMTDHLIRHDGYEQEVMRVKDKPARNLPLQERMVQEEPDNMRWHYFLAREKAEAGYPEEEVLETIERGLKQRAEKAMPDSFHLRSLLLQAKLLDARPGPLNPAAEAVVEQYPDCTDGLYYQLNRLVFLGLTSMLRGADETLARLQSLENPYSLLQPQSDHLMQLMGRIYLAGGQYGKAMRVFSAISEEEIRGRVKEELADLRGQLDAFLDGPQQTALG
ncbi:hypothetical protein N6H14_04590 [Paenibacillus sp. CC-CFT747]|nr:hypothetical protein N6H14_04590 [Paenibacillus sp. CC-CFT747]